MRAINTIKLTLCFIFFQSFSFKVNALDLIEAYQLALKNDAQYQSAYFEHEAGTQYEVMGKSSLMPYVSANYLRSQNKAHVDFKNADATRTEHRDYVSQVTSIQIRQPIIHYEGMARYRYGKAQSALGEQAFVHDQQELITRVFNQYVATLYAQDYLDLTAAKKNAYAEQKKTNDYLFAKGEGTKTEAYESQAKFDLAEAELIEAQNALEVEFKALSVMLGQEVHQLNAIQHSITTHLLQTSDFATWKDIALENNPLIKVQQRSVEMAREAVNMNAAGHMPKLDAVASLSQTMSDTTNTFNQEATTQSIGLQLSIPIYAGGLVTAQTAQAQFNLQKEEAELKKKKDEISLDLHKQFLLLGNGEHKINALNHAVLSATLLVEVTKKSLAAGFRTNLDVLNAEYQLFQAKRDLALMQYQFLQSFLNFKKATGQLSVDDLRVVANQFQP